MSAEPQPQAVAALAAVLALAGAAAPALAQDAWREFADPATGVAAQFPGAPDVSQSAYPAAGGPVPSTVYALSGGGREFSLAVADFSERPGDAGRAVRDALAQLRAGGEVKLDVDECVSGQPGRELSLLAKNGGQAKVSIFQVGRRVYFLEARIAPEAVAQSSGDAVRFQQSLRFSGGRLGPGPAVTPTCRGRAREASEVGG